MDVEEVATAWRRMRVEQERRLAASATTEAVRAVHLKLAALHERALAAGENKLLIARER